MRDPAKLQGKYNEPTEVVQGDVLNRASLVAALDGVETAYYLVHLMASSPQFEQQDREAAENFAAAAKAAGLRRIIYLGGLGDDDDPTLSPHLRSRHEVGDIFRRSGVEVIEFRASVVVGSGSLSFDLIQSLTNRLPVMICPRWLATPTQPIAIEDMLRYLTAALDLPSSESRIFEVGGSEIVTYGNLIQEYARQRGLRRWLISVPILTPRLSSLWLGLVTPASAEVGRHLIEGLRNPTVVRNPDALQAFALRPMGIEQAIREALQPSDSAD
ncbi:probable oxidoreductase-putative NAD-dependent nucleoside-diphosphate-sugar epimerase [Blastopirellula marina DSM 3645]|uniref:Probable oxidoreductase-putative NAD-dependent nucleoside-diphosphate-sugar epimerase n=1 Tax=Blastopirellula marina DSM 3645 TaxID=314230 RepID=A3ZLY2_9BACT|nr:probable oxidoreductase-putative NAD-dependent nucleoside-diphosphate-sugar epimerase [Blastopirellula marina DSM 3645]